MAYIPARVRIAEQLSRYDYDGGKSMFSIHYRTPEPVYLGFHLDALDELRSINGRESVVADDPRVQELVDRWHAIPFLGSVGIAYTRVGISTDDETLRNWDELKDICRQPLTDLFVQRYEGGAPVVYEEHPMHAYGDNANSVTRVY